MPEHLIHVYTSNGSPGLFGEGLLVSQDPLRPRLPPLLHASEEGLGAATVQPLLGRVSLQWPHTVELRAVLQHRGERDQRRREQGERLSNKTVYTVTEREVGE